MGHFATGAGKINVNGHFAKLAEKNSNQGLLRNAGGEKPRSRTPSICSQERINMKGCFATLRGKIEVERGYAHGKRMEM